MRALRVLAGPKARALLRDRGLRPDDVRIIPAAAGGPKGLALTPLDAALFGAWLPQSQQTIHLLGASIGAWRMAAACRADPVRALAELADDYVTQDYPHEPGRQPLPATISRLFGETLHQRLGANASEILSHPRFRLHVVTSRGQHVLRREHRFATPVGYAGAFVANAVSRRALGTFLERIVFSDPRAPLPIPLDDFKSRVVTLDETNLAACVLASCSIPFWLNAVHDIAGAPPGAYWDGGITDYHLHLNYAALTDGIVLYPHFQTTVVPGWLDKVWRHRHRATTSLDRVVVLAPDPAWVKAVMPKSKLPDRGDFKAYGEHGVPARMADWRKAINVSQQLADEFITLADGRPIDAEPLP
jgi:hypothetical protein